MSLDQMRDANASFIRLVLLGVNRLNLDLSQWTCPLDTLLNKLCSSAFRARVHFILIEWLLGKLFRGFFWSPIVYPYPREKSTLLNRKHAKNWNKKYVVYSRSHGTLLYEVYDYFFCKLFKLRSSKSGSDRPLQATWTKTAAPTWIAAQLWYGAAPL